MYSQDKLIFLDLSQVYLEILNYKLIFHYDICLQITLLGVEC